MISVTAEETEQRRTVDLQSWRNHDPLSQDFFAFS